MAVVDDGTYRLLTPGHLRRLAEIELSKAPVLSLYLQLTPERRVGRAWHSFFSSLVTATLRRFVSHRERETAREDFDRIEQVLAAELPAMGRGVVFFVCRPLGLWRQIALSVPLPDSVHLSSRPYIRPLVRTRDEHDRFVLALLSQAENQFFISQIGQVEEVFRIQSDHHRALLADRPARDRRDDVVMEAVGLEARVLAHVAEMVTEQFEGRHLVLSGASDLRTAVVAALPKRLLNRVGGEFTVELHARPHEVALAAEPALTAIEEREELATLRHMIEAGPSGTAWGEGPTFAALRDGRVMILAVDDTIAKAGSRCSICKSLYDVVPSTCVVCNANTLEVVEDVVELAIEQAFEQQAALEIVRSNAARTLMNARGRMAALLRW